MAWHGDGEVLRSCDEQDLLTLCPYIAAASGIESRKHRPGVYVPIPARHMIGEVIARNVMERKLQETGPENIQRRLQEERTRSMSSLDFRSGSSSRQFGEVQNLGASGIPRSRLSRSVQSLNAYGVLDSDCPTPATWMASKTIYDVNSTTGRSGTPQSGFQESLSGPANSLAPIRVPSSASSTTSLSLQDSVSSQFSSSTRVTSPTSLVSADSMGGNQAMPDISKSACSTDPTSSTPGSPDSQHIQLRQQTPQSQRIPYAGPSHSHERRDGRIDSTGSSRPTIPQRYAPRRPSGLRSRPVTPNVRIATHSSSSQSCRDYTMNTPNKNLPLPGRPPMPRRRRGSLASLSRLSIPERINEEHHEIPNASDSIREQTWTESSLDHDRYRLQGTVPQMPPPAIRRAQGQRGLNNTRSPTPSFHPSNHEGQPGFRARTPSGNMLDMKCPVTLIEVIEEKQRRSRKPSRSDE